MKALLQKNNVVVSDNVHQALSFASRLKGLMFSKELPVGQSLLIQPCNSVHTFFMRFPIDVLFLSNSNEIVDVRKNMKPYRLTSLIPNSRAVLETNAGTIEQHQIEVGDQLRFET